MIDKYELKMIEKDFQNLSKIIKYSSKPKTKERTIPGIFNKIYDENFLSDFLSYILNPAVNGIGVAPLLKVVEDYSDEATIILQNLNVEDRENVEVIREYSFDNKRRIDILIKIQKDLIVAIENKIYSSESDNQTNDYAKSIYKRYPNCTYVFLYLTLKGVRAVNADFHSISYKQLIDSLKKVNFDYRDDIRRKVIFDEFILHVEEYMIDKEVNHNVSELTKLYLEYQDTISKLEKSFIDDSELRFEMFENTIRSFFADQEWEFNINKNRSYQQVYKKSWLTDRLFVHYEFWISARNILSESKVDCFIEVEKVDKVNFLDKYDDLFRDNVDTYKSKEIIYKPKHRKIAIALKTLKNEFSLDYIVENKLTKELENLKFINEQIDETILFLRSKYEL